MTVNEIAVLVNVVLALIVFVWAVKKEDHDKKLNGLIWFSWFAFMALANWMIVLSDKIEQVRP